MWCLRPPVHAQHVEEPSEAQREAQRRRNSLGKMNSLDDAGEEKLQEHSQQQARKEHSQQQAEAHVSARDHSRLSLRTGARRSTSIL